MPRYFALSINLVTTFNNRMDWIKFGWNLNDSFSGKTRKELSTIVIELSITFAVGRTEFKYNVAYT